MWIKQTDTTKTWVEETEHNNEFEVFQQDVFDLVAFQAEKQEADSEWDKEQSVTGSFIKQEDS